MLGINPSTLNDFTNSVMPAQNPLSGNEAKLFIYSPKPIPHQVLRSYTYGFTPNFVDAISGSNTQTLEYSVGLTNGGNVPDINKIILPDGEGKMVDLSTWCGLWTFTLIIDLTQSTYGGIVAPGVRKIASGYFYGSAEPGTIDQYGNFVLNPNAVLIFTHVTNIAVRVKAPGPYSPSDGLFVSPHTFDYAGESVPIFYNEDMFVGTPGDMLKAAYVGSDSGFTDYSEMSLSNTKEGLGQKTIDNDLKSPRAQLSTIMQAIDTGIDQTNVNQPVYDRMSNTDDYVDPVSRAIDTTVHNLPSSMHVELFRGLDTSRPITLSELDEMFPDMTVYPNMIRQDSNYGWDVAQQVGINNAGQMGPIVSPKQVFSALSAATIQAICASLDIASAAFSYRWLDSNGIMAGKNDAFNISKFDLMVPRDSNVTTMVAKKMKQYLDYQLFEVIHDNVGEFEINCICDLASTILIDLRLFDYPDSYDGAYYETDSKLGGILNPVVGNINVVNNNVNQLYSTVKNITGRAFVDQAFSVPQSVPTLNMI